MRVDCFIQYIQSTRVSLFSFSYLWPWQIILHTCIFFQETPHKLLSCFTLHLFFLSYGESFRNNRLTPIFLFGICCSSVQDILVYEKSFLLLDCFLLITAPTFIVFVVSVVFKEIYKYFYICYWSLSGRLLGVIVLFVHILFYRKYFL